jgi:hypothetical protein
VLNGPLDLPWVVLLASASRRGFSRRQLAGANSHAHRHGLLLAFRIKDFGIWLDIAHHWKFARDFIHWVCDAKAFFSLRCASLPRHPRRRT